MSAQIKAAAVASKHLLLTAARMLIDEKDGPDFQIAEAMLRTIINERSAHQASKHLLRMREAE